MLSSTRYLNTPADNLGWLVWVGWLGTKDGTPDPSSGRGHANRLQVRPATLICPA